MFEPALRIWFWIDELAPVPIATITITAATPMIMPSAVSAVRIALRRSAFSATMNVIQIDIAVAPYALCAASSASLRSRATSAAALRRCTTGPIAPHQAVAERDDARGVLGDVGLVRDEHDGDAALDVEPLEDAHHLDAGARIEVAGRLVGKQQRRVVHQRPRDRDALLLAAGQLIRMMAHAVREADRLQRLGRALAALRGRRLPLYSSGSSTFSSADVRDSRLNPWKTNPISALRTRASSRAVQPRHVLAVQHVLPARRPIEAADQVHERRLAGARRAGQRDELARHDVERDASQRGHLHLADVVSLREIPDGDHGARHRPAPPRAPPAAPPAPAPRFAPARAARDGRTAAVVRRGLLPSQPRPARQCQ